MDMETKRILVVEDEADIRELVSYNLTKSGYEAVGAVSGEEALALMKGDLPDLVLLDLMLPGMDGLAVCERLKKKSRTATTPIVMLTAKGEESDVVRGLNLGADDYITKPFSLRELMARVQAVLRRASGAGDGNLDDSSEHETIAIHDLVVHPQRHEVLVSGEPVNLSATEFRTLALLARKPGWVLTRQQILDGVHGENYAITNRAVDVQIVGLRRKLGTAGKYIETVRGVGYRFKE